MFNVLVIDDDVEQTTTGDSIRRILESLDCNICFVSDGEQGVEILKTDGGKYHLVLLDVEFKRQKKQGFELLYMIRSFNTQIPILAISGSNYANALMARTRRKGIKQCQGAIGKNEWDFSPEKVIKKLKKFLKPKEVN